MVFTARASLPVLHQSFRDWLSDQVRIDQWGLDIPGTLATRVAGKSYPSNIGLMLPAQEIEFTDSQKGVLCTAIIRFQIKYRFSKLLPFDQIPLVAAEGILNNLYFLAITERMDIHDSIQQIATPDKGIDFFVSKVEDNGDSDWLLILNPDFKVTFAATLADLSDLQPVNPVEPPVTIKRFELGIYRAIPGFSPEEPETYILDRKVRLLDLL